MTHAGFASLPACRIHAAVPARCLRTFSSLCSMARSRASRNAIHKSRSMSGRPLARKGLGWLYRRESARVDPQRFRDPVAKLGGRTMVAVLDPDEMTTRYPHCFREPFLRDFGHGLRPCCPVCPLHLRVFRLAHVTCYTSRAVTCQGLRHFRFAPRHVTVRHVTQKETQGQRLWAVMKRQNQTNITRLAAKAKIDRPALTRILGDTDGLGPVRAARLAKALGVPVSEVLLPKPPQPRGLERRLQAIESDVRRLHEMVGRVAGVSLPESQDTAQPSQGQPRPRRL